MIEDFPTPSRLLRTVAHLARWVLWLLASVWITLLLVWGALHFLIVPRISELRPWLEEQATQALGIRLRLGDVVARSNGLIPSVELKDVQLFDEQGRLALRLPSVQAAFSPRSVFGGGFEQLYIDSPVLEVRRSADGRLWVAGLALTRGPDTDSPAVDWLFSQFELAIRHGTVTWTDELRAAPPLTLTDLDWVLRNRHHTHAMRLDATPPQGWGERLSFSGIFKQPLLSQRAGQWRDWKGQLYANLVQIDLAQLHLYHSDTHVDMARGSGSLRAWIEIDHAEPTAATLDLAVKNVNLRFDHQREALDFAWVAGRLGAKKVPGGVEFFTQALEFDTADGLHWPGGNVRLGLFSGDANHAAHGDLLADRLDLAALGQIVSRLPLDDALKAQVEELAPRGLVQSLQASWTGAPHQPSDFSARGRLEQLAIAPARAAHGRRPGFNGVDLDFDLNRQGGHATVALRDGAVLAPGIFDDPVIALEQLAGEVQWKHDAGRWNLQLSNVRLANADAQGTLQLKWQSDSVASAPGLLDLQGSLSRAQLNRVYRYLPQGIDKKVRDYVRDAVQGGSGSAVSFNVKGNLRDFPFLDPRQGEFRIAASLHEASYAYAPASVLGSGSLPWPALTQFSSDFLIDKGNLHIMGGHGGIAGSGALQVSKVDGLVSNLYVGGAQVAVSADARGPLAELLGVVNTSPLAGLTGRALANASASGNADYRFKLAFPIAAVERIAVQGTIALAGNDLQISADTPRLARARGSIAFTENGFSVAGVQARALGGDVRIEGGLNVSGAPTRAPVLLRLQGTASAEGLRQARELGFVARLAQYGSGSSAYTATLGLRAKVPELLVSSTLVGMALNLPAPFAKAAETPLPLRLETKALGANAGRGAAAAALDQWQLDLGERVSVLYVRDISGAEARVVRGAIAIGLADDESAPLPEQGVVASVNTASVDVDAWSQVLAQGSDSGINASSTASTSASSSASSTVRAAGNAAAMGYLPTSLVVRAQELSFGGRKLNHVLLGGSRDGLLWRGNLDAEELNGYVEYRQSLGPTAGRFYARLARLAIGHGTAQDVENLLDEQPASIPALDIVVDDFELRGKKLGHLDIEAVNVGAGAARDASREWRLNRFNIVVPEATLTATGNWTNIVSLTEPTPRRSIRERRRTAMKFKLDIADAGALLERFGMAGVVRRGKGTLEGRVGWLGSPITLDYPSLGGDMKVAVETGQFLKTDPGVAKLLGVLSLQSLPRRLMLDFRDVFSEGFAFDYLRGDVTMEQGIARTNNLQMKGVSAAVLMEGSADIAKETQNIKVLVVPEINAGSASLIASTINPLVGLTSFLAQLILRQPLIEATTQEYLVDGSWLDPHVTQVERRSAAPAGAASTPKEKAP